MMIRTAAVSACRALGALRSPSTPTTTIATTTASSRFTPSFSKALLVTSTLPNEEHAMRWRFPVDDRTQGMMAAVKHGMNQTTILTFNSKAPITPDLMEEALVHLYSKTESLRLCLRMRQGQLWLADMPQRKIDFQVVSGTDLEEEHDSIIKSPFNFHDGPLWKVRLMPCPADAPCEVPKVKAAFPHQYYLLMSIHHAFNDGVVVLSMTETLLRIIDSLLEGTPVNTKPIGELRDGVEAREEENRIRTELERDPDRLQAALRKLEMSKHLPLIIEAYGVPDEANPTTVFLKPIVLDIDMEKIAAKCRSIGATLNACFTAICNISMMEIVQDAGLKKNVYNISTRHPVDSRRLMKNCKSLPLGYHGIPFTQCTPTPRDAKKNFWQYVQHLDSELRQKLKSNYMCEQRVLEEMMRPEGFTHEGKYAVRQIPDCDYLFSNLYNPKGSQQKGIGKNVQITAGGNYMGIQNENVVLAQGVFSSKGQVRIQNAYTTRSTTEEVCKRCLEKNVATFYDVSKMLD